MAFVLQQLINALALGSIYALMAIGLAIIFGILRLINFAHGELLMIGPYFVLALSLVGVPFGLGVVLAVVVAGAVRGPLGCGGPQARRGGTGQCVFFSRPPGGGPFF